jgi:hypothetical protein
MSGSFLDTDRIEQPFSLSFMARERPIPELAPMIRIFFMVK